MSYYEALKDAGYKGHISGDEFHTRCTFCGRNKLYINVRTGFYICFSGNCARRGHVKQIITTHNIDPDKLFSQNLFDIDIESGEEPKINNISEINEDYNFVHKYLIDRGFTKEYIIANHIGYDKDTHRITIPIYSLGTYYGYIKRSVVKDVDPKYMYPAGYDKSKHLFMPWSMTFNQLTFDQQEGLKDKKVLLVTEGSLDALMANQRGYMAVSILGCDLSQAQADQLSCYQDVCGYKIVLMLDNDEAGAQGVVKAQRKYPLIDFYLPTYERPIDNGDDVCHTGIYKDICDMTEQQLDDIVANVKHKFDLVLKI